MKQALYKTYENRQPCGATYITNCFGLLIYEPTADYITAWSGTDAKKKGFRRNKVF